MRAWLAAPLAALGLAAGGDGREEYTPRTHPVEADGECRRGFAFQERLRDKAAVCVRPCRPRHLLLDDQARDRLRCVPTRRSRLWYRARLDADVRFDAGGTATGPRGDTIVTTEETTQRWRFRSAGAALVSRRCTPDAEIGPEGARLVAGVPQDAGRVPCRRVARALGTELFEDISFGFRGTITGGAERDRTQRDVTGEVRWDTVRPDGTFVRGAIPTTCARTLVTTVTGDGPVYEASVETRERSARFGGTSIAAERLVSLGSGVTAEDAWRCPPPAGAADPDQHSAPARSSAARLQFLLGIELGDLFTPDLAAQFGRRTMTVERIVRRDRSQAGSPHVTLATFTLTLTRCPDAGRDPRSC